MTRLQGNDSNRMFLVLGTLLAAALIALAIFAVRGKPAAGDGLSANFNLTDLPFVGKADAPVNVVVVEDFKCPICKEFEASVAPQLKTKYVDTGKIKLYSLIWPFLSEVQRQNPDDSKLAAQAAKCVFDQGGGEMFDRFKSILFRAQGQESVVWATNTRLKDLATNVAGLDQAKFATCLDTNATAARVDADEKQSSDAGVRGTPTVFVNGKQVVQTSGLDQLLTSTEAAIEAALKK